MSSPLCKRFGFPMKFYNAIIPFVVGLFNWRCPLAVFWGIPCVVIPAFNLQATAVRWPHILKKIVEVVPSLAKSNAPCSVIFKRSVGFIKAALLDVLPYGGKGGFGFIVQSKISFHFTFNYSTWVIV